MSQNLDEVYNTMFDNKVAQLWHKVSYPSKKPLGSWILNFIERYKQRDIYYESSWLHKNARLRSRI